MKKIVWFGLVVLQELKMLKFKSIFRYLYDSRYRKDINNLARLLSPLKLTSKIGYLEINEIKFSHDVTYPSWVMSLIRDLDNKFLMKPIKVIYDENAGRYIVVDGNHRLMALKLTRYGRESIAVRILFPVGQNIEERHGA